MKTNSQINAHQSLKLSEIRIFLAATQQSSVRQLARSLGLSPGQISKILQGIEKKLGKRLFLRSVMGLSLTPEARGLIASFQKIQTLVDEIDLSQKPLNPSVLSIAAPPYFNSHFLPTSLEGLESLHQGLQLELLDIAPDQLMAAGLRQAFQACLHAEDLEWPKTWVSYPIGELHWRLYGRKGHPLGASAPLGKILDWPFTSPVYWSHQGKTAGFDHFPVSFKKRILGHRTTTALTAAQLIARSNHLGFLPAVVGQPFVRLGDLNPIKCPQLKEIRQPVFLTVKADQIKSRLCEDLVKALTTQLKSQKTWT